MGLCWDTMGLCSDFPSGGKYKAGISQLPFHPQGSFERVFSTPSLQAAVTGAVMIEHLEKEVEANMVKAQPVPREADPH